MTSKVWGRICDTLIVLRWRVWIPTINLDVHICRAYVSTSAKYTITCWMLVSWSVALHLLRSEVLEAKPACGDMDSWKCSWTQACEHQLSCFSFHFSVVSLSLEVSWPLTITGLKLHGSTCMWIFSQIPVLLLIYGWKSRVWRVHCMDCSTPFYMGDLSVCGFWYSQWVLEPMPLRPWETTVNQFWGSRKLHVDFLLCGELAPLPGTFLGTNCRLSQNLVWVDPLTR